MITQIVIWLNTLASAAGSVLLAPVQWLPGWLSSTIIGIVTGVLMLVVFKYTSNQSGIKRTRDAIKANMLALSLFRDNIRVSLRCQAGLLAGAAKLLLFSLVPMAVLTVPMILVLGQMSLWYQARPLAADEESVVTVQLKEDAADAVSTIRMTSTDTATIVTGPVRIPGRHMVCWNLTPAKVGVHELQFDVAGETFTKQFASGRGYEPVSIKRPSRVLGELLMHPREAPFPPDSVVQSIEVTYPDRDGFSSGTNNWVIYWFIVSMIGAFAAKPFLNVNI
ncbi:MAG: hypothetical protein R3C19_16510 [Planctomycetaceae bacterium]